MTEPWSNKEWNSTAVAISMEDKLQQRMSNTPHSNIFNGKLFFKQADTNNTSDDSDTRKISKDIS